MFNLKEIISSIADVGQKLFKKSVIKKNDLDSIVSLCDDLLSNKGAAFGITVARDVLQIYQKLSDEEKLSFFNKINDKYKPNSDEINKAIDEYNKLNNSKTLSILLRTTEGKRRELFNRLNMAPNGTSEIDCLGVCGDPNSVDFAIGVFNGTNFSFSETVKF